jgi:hypothetical protein
MPIASVHVSNKPLSGVWDGQHWEPQTARCSNDFMSGPTPPVPPPVAAGGLIWQVLGPSFDPNSVVFNVSVNIPHGDEVLFTGLRNGAATGFLPTPTVTEVGADHVTPFHKGHRWDEYYSRGIYIASVFGAPEPFMINILGAGEGLPCGSVIANLNVNGSATFYIADAVRAPHVPLPANSDRG